MESEDISILSITPFDFYQIAHGGGGVIGLSIVHLLGQGRYCHW
jgi:hypothetical protein